MTTNFRALTDDELLYVSGGNGADIYVIGRRLGYGEGGFSYGGGGWDTDQSNHQAGGGEEDSDYIQIESRVFDPTPEQLAAFEELKEAIDRIIVIINAIPSNAVLNINGLAVTGLELKTLWASTDFTINNDGYIYSNLTQRGEAAYNNGDPMISFNIGTLLAYADLGDAGLNYLVLHELAHLTAANRHFDANNANPQESVERMANDIARAIANSGLADFLPATGEQTPTHGFSTDLPMTFEVPSTGDGDSGGGSTGDGGTGGSTGGGETGGGTGGGGSGGGGEGGPIREQ